MQVTLPIPQIHKCLQNPLNAAIVCFGAKIIKQKPIILGPRVLKALQEKPDLRIDAGQKLQVPVDKPFGDEQLEILGGISPQNARKIGTLILRSTNITDRGLTYLNLQNFTSLKKLDLANTEITNAGLAHLEYLTHLEELDLAGTQITNTGLKCLKPLTNLNKLDLASTQISGTGFKYLQDLNTLKTLYLSDDMDITDEGLEYLQGLTLQRIFLWKTKTPKIDKDRLQTFLPNRIIIHK